MTDSADNGLGLDKSKVVVVEHDARWAERFRGLSAEIAAVLEPLGVDARIAHVGSTAVPGLRAKPILDVAVGLGSDVETAQLVDAFAQVSLEFQGDLGDFGGLFFTCEPSQGFSIANVHVVEQGNFQWSCYLLFRDELRANESLRRDYGALKTSLAVDFANDRLGYSQAKSEFVYSVVRDLADGAGIGLPSTEPESAG